MDEGMYTEYNAAIGSVIAAQRDYDDAVVAHGKDSDPAIQANESLQREIEKRRLVRERYDAQ